MSGLHHQPDDGATPLSAEEREGLIPTHIALRRELNEAEQANIIDASAWALGRKHKLLTEDFAKALHKRMYGSVWSWAGAYRKTGKNIGVEPVDIQSRLHATMQDFEYWIAHKTYPSEELAVRFHHALVLIHPFPNGNGRWSRMMADLLAAQLKISPFTWGRSDLREDDAVRRSYIDALRHADRHYDYAPLLAFARS